MLFGAGRRLQSRTIPVDAACLVLVSIVTVLVSGVVAFGAQRSGQNQSWRELLVAGERQCDFSDVRWSQGREHSTGRPPVSLPCSDALSPAI